MKSSPFSSYLLKFLFCLLAGVSFTLTACQKAKMTSIPRREAPKPGPGITETTPEVDTDTTSPEQPPVTIPRDSGGESDDDTPRPPTDVGPRNGDFGVTPDIPRPQPPVVVEPTTPERPVTDQPELPNNDRNEIPWLDPNAPAHPSVLDRCSWEKCEEPRPPAQPVEIEGKSYTQTSKAITTLLDVVFVVDTSNSLDKERAAIATNLHRFTEEVAKVSQRSDSSEKLDINFGVILAHGPESRAKNKTATDTFGNLFVHPGETLAPEAVLSTQTHTIDQIKSALLSRFNGNGNVKSVRDQSNTQGEAGLLSLEAYLQKQLSNSTGFPRDGAALMVVFVSDENDVCFDYNKANQQFGTNYSPQVDSSSKGKVELAGIFRDKPEHEAFISACEGGMKGQAQSIIHQLQTIKGYSTETHDNLPLIPTAIVYRNKDEAKQAQKEGGTFSGDNEMGHGYIDVVEQMSGGKYTSLRGADYGVQLANYGKNALFEMNFYSTLPIVREDGTWVDFREVSTSSVRVQVEVKAGPLTGQTVSLRKDQDYHINTTQLTPDSPISGHIVLQEKQSSGLHWHNAVIRIYFTEDAQ